MKKQIAFWLLLGLSSSFLASAQFIEGQTYSCQRVISPLQIDGLSNEDSWQKASWSNTFVDIEGDKKPSPFLKTQVKMLWDDDYFYFYAQLEEPHIWARLKQRDTVIYWDNDFELFIDPTGNTHNYYELEINALNTVWDLMLTKPYRDGGKAITAMDITGLKTAVHIEGTLNNTTDIDAYWSVEAAIPWKILLETVPIKQRNIAGKQMRINYSRVQWGTDIVNGKYVKKKQREFNWVWSPQRAIAMHEPEFWGRVYFSLKAVGSIDQPTFDKNSEKIRQILYGIHRLQRRSLKKLGGFSNVKNEMYYGETPIDWTLDADKYWYHVKLIDPFNNKRIWHIDETGKVWKEELSD